VVIEIFNLSLREVNPMRHAEKFAECTYRQTKQSLTHEEQKKLKNLLL
jgi:hypothetical protein